MAAHPARRGGRAERRPPLRGAQSVVDLDVDGHAVGDHVEDGRARLGALDDLAQLLGRRVALDAEGHADALEAVARLVVDAQRAAHVHVALERRLDRREPHLARRGDVDDRRRQARGQRVQQVLGRVRAGVGAEQDRRLARVELERLAAAGVLAAGGVEALDRRAVVGAVDPAVVARNWNCASSGCALIRSSVANIVSVFTPLRIVSVAVVMPTSSGLVRLVREPCPRAARATSAPPPKSVGHVAGCT